MCKIEMQGIKYLIRPSFIANIFGTRFFGSISLRDLCPDTPINSTMRHYLNSNQPGIALAHFLKWRERGLMPDRFSVPTLVKLLVALNRSLLHGEHIHSFAIKSSFIGDIFVSTSLVEMYFKYGDFESPHRLFNDIGRRDVALFTAMISGLSQNELNVQALGIFFEMLNEGIEPNEMSLTATFSLCSQMKNVTLGKILHGLSLRRGLLIMSDVILQTAMVDMYAKCGNLRYARKVFDKMHKRNFVSWNSIIFGYFAHEKFQTALRLFKIMVFDGWWVQPKSSTLCLALNICGAMTDLRNGKEVHGYILKCNSAGNELEKLTESNALIDMYVKSGEINYSILIFQRMHRKSVVTWTTMISGYGTYGGITKALDLFYEMNKSGTTPDGVTFLSILSACSHNGLIHEGKEIFRSMTQYYNIVPEMKHYVCMVDLYGRAGLLKEAFDFIMAMPIKPSKFVWGALLSCCRNHKNLELGEFAAKKALELDRYDVGNYVLLCRLYADAKRWEDVARVRSVINELGLKVRSGCSWVEMKGNVN